MKKKSRCIYFLVSIILISLINCIGYHNNKIEVAIKITIATLIVLIGIVVICVKNEEYLFDLRFIVLVFYYIYNFYTPIIYIFNDSSYITYMNKNNFSFSYETLINTINNSNTYLIGLVIGIIILGVKRKKVSLDIRNINININININYWIGVFTISFLWYIYPYFKLGFGEAIALDRWSRYVLFGEIKNSGGIYTIFNLLFSNVLIILSITMICKSYLEDYKSKYKKIIFYFIVTFQSVFWLFIDVRRREVLYLVIIIFFLYKQQFNFKIRIKQIIILSIIGIMFVGYQYVKNYFPTFVKEGLRSAIYEYKVDNSRKDTTEKLLQNEFGLVYVNNLYIADNYITKENGKTYIEALIKNIPIFNYILYEWFGFEKTYIISDIMTEGYYDIYSSGGGLGFSPAAEAAVNFGNATLGCALVGFFTGIILNIIMKIFYNSKRILLYALLLVQGVNFCRITLVGVTQEIVWIFIYYTIYRILEIIVFKRKKNLLSCYEKIA